MNPPGAGGDPLVYPATTLAALAAWFPPSPVALPGARVSLPAAGSPAGQNAKNAASTWSDCPCFDPQLARIMKWQERQSDQSVSW